MTPTKKMKLEVIALIRQLRKTAMHDASAEAVEALRDIGLRAVGTLEGLRATEACEANFSPPVLAVAAKSTYWPISISAFKEERRDWSENVATGIKLGSELPFDTSRTNRDFSPFSSSGFTRDELEVVEQARTSSTRAIIELIPSQVAKELKEDFQRSFREAIHAARHDPAEVARLEFRLEKSLNALEPDWRDAAAALPAEGLNENTVGQYAKVVALKLHQETLHDWSNTPLPSEITKRAASIDKDGSRYGERRAISDYIKANFKNSLKKSRRRK